MNPLQSTAGALRRNNIRFFEQVPFETKHFSLSPVNFIAGALPSILTIAPITPRAKCITFLFTGLFTTSSKSPFLTTVSASLRTRPLHCSHADRHEQEQNP